MSLFSKALVLISALTTLLFLAACGGSSPKVVPPPSGGFSNSNLNGTYIFSSTGADSSTSRLLLAFAGALTADGNGHITGGTMDVIGPDVTFSSPVAQPISGSYTIGVDGRGQITLGSVIFTFVLSSSSHGLITEFDGSGSGSGTIDLQSAVTLSQLSGSYAFTLAGQDSSFNPTATAGSFSLDTAGNLTTGVQDFNDNGFVFSALPISASTVTAGTGTGPHSITLTTTQFGALTFDVYPIDATHLKLIETDAIQFLAGDAFTQTGASIPTGAMVFTVAGVDNNGPVAAGGLFTSDGTGNITAGLEDVNDGGSVSPSQLAFTGAASSGGSVGGRVLVDLTGFVPATQYVIYPVVDGFIMLETDASATSSAITTGTAFAQTSQTFQSGQGYGMNLGAFNTSNGVEEDDNSEFTTSSGTLAGIVDINDEGNTTFKQALSGSYAVDSPATGRGEITSTLASLVFYVVNSSTVIFVETDSNQIGTGTLQLQSTPTAVAAVAIRPALSVPHPVSRAHTATRHNK